MRTIASLIGSNAQAGFLYWIVLEQMPRESHLRHGDIRAQLCTKLPKWKMIAPAANHNQDSSARSAAPAGWQLNGNILRVWHAYTEAAGSACTSKQEHVSKGIAKLVSGSTWSVGQVLACREAAQQRSDFFRDAPSTIRVGRC